MSARIFTAEEELPFTGHPVIGAAAALHERHAAGDPARSWVYLIAGREITVRSRRTEGHYEAELTVHSDELSPYALMTVGDGDLIKAVLLNAGVRRRGRGLRVLEWGAGLSTLSFSAILSEEGIPFHWLALEYDRGFCESSIAPELLSRPGGTLRYVEDDRTVSGPPGTGTGKTEVVCWNRAALRPFLGEEHLADRSADLDAYVDYPGSAGSEFDVVLVDGRKRRRCLLTALDLAGEHTAVLLHDSSRMYYHPAMREYPASRFIGDDLWIGAASEATLAMALASQDGRA